MQSIIHNNIDCTEIFTRELLKKSAIRLVADDYFDAITFEPFAFWIDVNSNDFSIGEIVPPHLYRRIDLHSDFDHPLDPMPSGARNMFISYEIVVPSLRRTKFLSELGKTKLTWLIDAVVHSWSGVKDKATISGPGGGLVRFHQRLPGAR